MNVKQLFDSGNLPGAIDALTEEVKAHPADPARRTLLFELLAFAGQFDRAAKQLDVISHQNVEAEWATQVYANILHAEQTRARVFSAGLKPEFFLDPPDYIHLHLDAINRLREGQGDEARALLDRAEEARPAHGGTAGDKPFEDFRDCDDVLAPFLELILIRDYIWLPLEQVRQLEISRPERPRDLLWAPVRVVLADDTSRRAYMPCLYCGSHAHGDNQVKLGRMTDWKSGPDGIVSGAGLREFLVGDDVCAMLELPTITFGAPRDSS
ncbi:MAG TPA: type VI secretion system accessory protein TagJ [Pirellulales bacterium]|jgi:type VI secretion system protein ImpE|nr:type VI secretion system accessory protein TagJ [Pirellulales bacterium]